METGICHRQSCQVWGSENRGNFESGTRLSLRLRVESLELQAQAIASSPGPKKGPGTHPLRMRYNTSKTSVKLSVYCRLPHGDWVFSSNKQLSKFFLVVCFLSSKTNLQR